MLVEDTDDDDDFTVEEDETDDVFEDTDEEDDVFVDDVEDVLEEDDAVDVMVVGGAVPDASP